MTIQGHLLAVLDISDEAINEVQKQKSEVRGNNIRLKKRSQSVSGTQERFKKWSDKQSNLTA